MRLAQFVYVRLSQLVLSAWPASASVSWPYLSDLPVSGSASKGANRSLRNQASNDQASWKGCCVCLLIVCAFVSKAGREKGLLRGRKLLRDIDSGFHVAGVPQSQSTLWEDALSCGHHMISWDAVRIHAAVEPR